MIGPFDGTTLDQFAPRARVGVFIGQPEYGKTFAAIQWTRAWHAIEGSGVLILDLGTSKSFDQWTPLDGPELVDVVWAQRAEALIRPRQMPRETPYDCAARVLAEVMELGCAHVLVDESSRAGDALMGRKGDFEQLCTLARHRRVTMALTTQNAGRDIPTTVWAAAPDVFCFNTPSNGALERMDRDFGLEREKIRALPPRHFFRVR